MTIYYSYTQTHDRFTSHKLNVSKAITRKTRVFSRELGIHTDKRQYSRVYKHTNIAPQIFGL